MKVRQPRPGGTSAKALGILRVSPGGLTFDQLRTELVKAGCVKSVTRMTAFLLGSLGSLIANGHVVLDERKTYRAVDTA